MRAPLVCVVVVSHNTRDDLLRSLASLHEHVRLPLEIVVVDNASADGSADAVAGAFPAVRLVRSGENLGFARANNLGARGSAAPYVLVLNSDAEVRGGAVEAMVRILETRSRVGVVGPRTLSSDGSVQVSFGPALTPLAELRQRRLVRGVRARHASALRRADEQSRREAQPDWVSASCLLARRSAWDEVGGFDEGFFLYEEDVDLCVRIRRAGWQIVFTPEAEVVHHLGRSAEGAPVRSRLEYRRSHLRYYRKHNSAVDTLVLRALLAASGLGGFVGALASGPAGRARRELAAATLQLAFSSP